MAYLHYFADELDAVVGQHGFVALSTAVELRLSEKSTGRLAYFIATATALGSHAPILDALRLGVSHCSKVSALQSMFEAIDSTASP